MPRLDEPIGWISLILGVILIALGLIPLLNTWGIIGFALPGGILGLILGIAPWIIAIVGVFLLVEGFLEDDAMRMITIIVALTIIGAGLIPILHSFGILGFTIPFLTPMILKIIFVVEGLFLAIAAFAMV